MLYKELIAVLWSLQDPEYTLYVGRVYKISLSVQSVGASGNVWTSQVY